MAFLLRLLPCCLGLTLACESGTVSCDEKGAAVDLSIAWGIPPASCELESCGDVRAAACEAVSVAEGPPLVLTLTCDYGADGTATDVITLALQPGGALDLAAGDTVQLEYRTSSGFETGGSTVLRLTDDAGLVLAVGTSAVYGGTVGDAQWATDFVAELFAPLTAKLASAGCDEATLSALTVAEGAVDVAVPEGGAGTLDVARPLQIVVETASVNYSGMLEGDLEIAALRVKP